MPGGWRKPSPHLQPVAHLGYTEDAQRDPFGGAALGREVDGTTQRDPAPSTSMP
jgi:hypothetical protein